MKFDVLITDYIKTTIFWDVMQCISIYIYTHQRLQGTCPTKLHCIIIWMMFTLKK